MSKFKQEILDKIKSDPDLFTIVTKALKIKPTSMEQTINRNGVTLNQYGIVKAVADYLKKKPEDLVVTSKVKEPAK